VIYQLFFRIALATAALPLLAAPRPGDVYREYHFPFRFGEVDPQAKRQGIERMIKGARTPRMLQIGSLSGVERAEVSVEYWGGHIGTSGQQFKVNGGGWHAVVQPQNTGTAKPAECYQRTILGRATTEIPLAELKTGLNEFIFTAGPQLCNSFNWGFYWVYSFTVRLYSKNPATFPSGELILPATGGEIGENPTIAAGVKDSDATITAVDFIANYRDFNWEGDGVFKQWHYITERGQMTHHVGTATRAPWSVKWDTTWIPDQEEPVELAARITDSAGRMTITPAVKVDFRRRGRSVKMYTSPNVPMSFAVRVGNRKECGFNLDGDLAKARAARLVLSTWSAAHDGEMGINGTKLVDRIGYVHNYSFDAIPFAPRLLKPGENKFYVFSKTTEHSAEINWPGPVLLVEYAVDDAAPPRAAASPITVEDLADFEGQASWRIRTPSATYVYHKEGAGFASIVDNAGAEWIGYRPGGRSAGEFRGFPNMGHDFGHPGDKGATSRMVSKSADRVEILSERHDGKVASRWEIFPSHATMTLLKVDKPYWILYEGVPGGKLNAADGYVMLSNGARLPMSRRWSDAAPNATWAYFADPSSRNVLFVTSDGQQTAPWQYWPMDGNMTVFGFGRELSCCGKYLTAVPARFTIGIVQDRGFDAVARSIEAAAR
jgi:hypothetical protein